MKSFAILTYFVAFLAMICNVAYAETVALERRDPAPGIDAVVSYLYEEHLKVVLTAYANVCTDADISSSIKSNLRFTINGPIDVDLGIASYLAGKIDVSVKAAVHGTVDAEIKKQYSDTLKGDLRGIIISQCPNADNACIKLRANFIAEQAIDLTISASKKISSEIGIKLNKNIQDAIDKEIKKYTYNFILFKVTVTGGVQVNNSLSLKFEAAIGICGEVLLSIKAKIVSQIKIIVG